jgi:ubiquinone/menaquinone biosynthesis C-methylase UbiE
MGYTEEVKDKKIDIIKTRFNSNLVYKEHLARYNFIRKFVKDKFILDLGCGIGDGTYNLSLEAKRVIGIELDRERLRIASGNFGNGNLNYLVMDGCLLGFKDESFDIVVSLEVIEHLENQNKFLFEINRVLKDRGIAIISTPNKKIIKIEGTEPNPLHLKELTFKEFKKLLKKYFRGIEFYGQRRGRRIKGISGIIHYFIRIIDLFKIRKLFPPTFKNNISTKIARVTGAKDIDEITVEDFVISEKNLRHARNIIALCKK